MNCKARAFAFLLCVTSICVLLWAPQFSINTNPCACGKCSSEDDPWTMQLFNKSVKPFLSSKDSLSEDDFSWWKHLQYERRNLGVYRQTVDNLFQMLSPSPDLAGPSAGCYRTCAVVGNSGNLKKSNYGSLIDVCDAVIRINRGVTKGYERDVGSRTTHRIMYPESAVDLDNTTHLVLVPFKIQDLEWLTKAMTTGFFNKSYAPVKPNIKANKDLVMVVSPAFMKYVHECWLENKGRYPSTGFMALVLALHICDQVYVFGYGADKDGNWNHYWENLQDKHFKTGIHPGTHEYDIIKKLAEKRKLEFYRGW